MGFLKKAFRGIGKVAKKIAPAALTAVGSAFGGPVGGMVGAGLGKMLGGFGKVGSDIASGVGNAVNTGITDSFTQFGNSIAGNNGGVPTVQTPPSTYGGNMTDGVNFIKNMETPIKSATEQGQDTKAYLAAAYPEMNPWERAGTGGTMFGSDMTGQIQSQEQNNKQIASQMSLQAMQLQKEYDLAKLQSDTALAVNAQNNQTALQTAGIASVTSRENNRDSVRVQQQQADIQSKRVNAEIGQIAANTEMSIQSKRESISRVIQNEAQTRNLNISAGQIRALTDEALARAGNVKQQTKTEEQRTEQTRQSAIRERYGKGHVMQDIYSGGAVASDIFSGIGSGIRDTWNKMWDNSDGVAGAMSRK